MKEQRRASLEAKQATDETLDREEAALVREDLRFFVNTNAIALASDCPLTISSVIDIG